MAEIDGHRRIAVALWIFSKLQKQNVISLKEIEEHTGRYSECMMHEYVVHKLFSGTSANNGTGWCLNESTKFDSLSEFHEKLNRIYKS